jgi:hypothetical protein
MTIDRYITFIVLTLHIGHWYHDSYLDKCFVTFKSKWQEYMCNHSYFPTLITHPKKKWNIELYIMMRSPFKLKSTLNQNKASKHADLDILVNYLKQ